MGREAKAKRARKASAATTGPIVMEPADYWRLKSAHVEAVHADAVGAQQIAQIQQQVGAVVAKRAEVFAELGARFSFAPDAPFQFDDACCALVPITEPTKEP